PSAVIPLHARRSMEDELLRPLPAGWVRAFDRKTKHQFFVDTSANPSRSIWSHPYDDEPYLRTLSAPERDRICSPNTGLHDTAAARLHTEQIAGESTDEDSNLLDHLPHPDEGIAGAHQQGGGGGDRRTVGRKLKDKITGMTHEQRVAARARREKEEQELYREHQILRRGMRGAMDTGRPQLLGEDDNGVKMFLEPPRHTFPGVVDVKRLSPYMVEVFYEPGQWPGPLGRYVRPEGDMYGYGYGGYDCGEY
ncbi:hypothetical protein B0T17DRAFT_469620, partial [Bombardia bombarda]